MSRSGGDQVSLLDTLPERGTQDPQTLVDRGGPRAQIAEAIAALPEREKLVIALYYCENLSSREIREVLGVTEPRVSQLQTKSVLRLRSKFSPELYKAMEQSERVSAAGESARLRQSFEGTVDKFCHVLVGEPPYRYTLCGKRCRLPVKHSHELGECPKGFRCARGARESAAPTSVDSGQSSITVLTSRNAPGLVSPLPTPQNENCVDRGLVGVLGRVGELDLAPRRPRLRDDRRSHGCDLRIRGSTGPLGEAGTAHRGVLRRVRDGVCPGSDDSADIELHRGRRRLRWHRHRSGLDARGGRSGLHARGHRRRFDCGRWSCLHRGDGRSRLS